MFFLPKIDVPIPAGNNISSILPELHAQERLPLVVSGKTEKRPVPLMVLLDDRVRMSDVESCFGLPLKGMVIHHHSSIRRMIYIYPVYEDSCYGTDDPRPYTSRHHVTLSATPEGCLLGCLELT